jgi:hypothetical protein
LNQTDVTRLLLGLGGVIVLGLVTWAIKVGRYPSRGDWVSKETQPITFWSVMTLSLIGGSVFVLIALLVR